MPKKEFCLKRQNILKMLFLSLILTSVTSCGNIKSWLGAEETTDSKPIETSSSANAADATDDLFSDSMTDSSKEIPLSEGSDAPSNITTAPTEEKIAEAPVEVKDELKSLEDEFSGAVKAEPEVAKAEPEVAKAEPEVAKAELQEVKVEESLPVIEEVAPPAITENQNMDAGKVMSYKVQKGETLMQIAFKIYGDISKWKELKALNGTRLASSSPLRAGAVIKYNAPEKLFVWNPEGTPRMIKTGETLGTISNDVYQTPKKWKSIWENNKPLIKNPNVIYAGFTLYYKNNGMSNYVQPKATQRKVASEEVETSATYTNKEFVNGEKKAELDHTSEIQSSTSRNAAEEINVEELKDEFETI